jgi:hypothetical protein
MAGSGPMASIYGAPTILMNYGRKTPGFEQNRPAVLRSLAKGSSASSKHTTIPDSALIGPWS